MKTLREPVGKPAPPRPEARLGLDVGRISQGDRDGGGGLENPEQSWETLAPRTDWLRCIFGA